MFGDGVRCDPDPEDFWDQQAYHFVQTGDVAGFNALRAAHPDWRPCFRECEFSEVSFAGFDWRGVNFVDALFYRVDFEGAVLDGVVGLTRQQIKNLCSSLGFFAL